MRRQFADPELKRGDPGFGEEKQVIQYPGVYRRVLPVLAKTIVFITAGKDMASSPHRSRRRLQVLTRLSPTVEPLRVHVVATLVRKYYSSRRDSRSLVRTQDLCLFERSRRD